MYSSFDFISLGEVAASFIDESNSEMMSQLPSDKSKSIEDLVMKYVIEQDNIMWAVAKHFSEQATFSACLPSGGVVRLSAKFLYLDVCKGQWAFHPGLDNGTLYIGTEKIDKEMSYLRAGGNFRSAKDAIRCAQLEHFRNLYRPLVGASIQVSARHAPTVLDDTHSAHSNSGRSDRRIVQEIVSLADAGMRRDDIKQAICPNFPTEVWRTLWKEAVRIEPKISKSGPKPRHSIRN